MNSNQTPQAPYENEPANAPGAEEAHQNGHRLRALVGTGAAGDLPQDNERAYRAFRSIIVRGHVQMLNEGKHLIGKVHYSP